MSDLAPKYGVKEQLGATDPIDLHVQAIHLLGSTLVLGAVKEPQLAELRAKVDRIVERQVEEGGGREAMLALGEANTARALLVFDEAFLELARDPTVLAICERTLGSYFILNQQNAVVLPPSEAGRQSSYHRDLPYQHLVTSRPLAISALFCLDDFTVDSGATFVLPASHRLEAYPDDALVARVEQQVMAPAGSYLVFDSMLYHRGGTNRGAGPRRAVNHVYSLPIIKQQLSLPGMLGSRFAAHPNLSRLLGYEAEPPRSLADWIASRCARQSEA
jgi:ectoine hydroxylase-related dioxygenase (phytanoyl-CoA dioxygenase family)